MNGRESIPARFDRIASRQPDRIAISAPGCEWTYRELATKAARVAAALQTLRGRPADPVALLLPHGPPLIAVIMGVLKAGRVYLALDPVDLPARMQSALEHSGAGCLVVDETTKVLARQIVNPSSEVLNIADAFKGRSIESGSSISPECGAWLMYTTGSTGEPKGVWQTHDGVVHLADVYARLVGMTPDDRLSLLTSCGLAASASAVFGALLTGATLCPFPLRIHGVERLLDWVKSYRITILHTVPTVFRDIMRLSSTGDPMAGLRWIRLGGEPVTRTDVELLFRVRPAGCRLLHAYSSTETGLACAEIIDSGTKFKGRTVPIGTSVDGTTVSLLGDDGRTVAAGEPGRIVVTSRGVAAGYWRSSAGSNGNFQPDGNGSGRRTFVTSDLGRMNADGTFEHLGRVDHQVKIRGRRVDLAAVDAGVRLLPGVADVATVARRDPRGNARLVAFVVAHPQARVDRTRLRHDLREMVPAAPIPDELRILKKLPQTAGGKIDHQALLHWKPEEPTTRGRVRPARDWFEKGMATIWRDTLGLPAVDRRDDFFELGGSSIELARVIARIDDEFGVTLPQSVFVEHPTIEQLGALLANQVVQTGSQALVRITGKGRLPPLVLVHGGKGDVAMFGQLARRISDRPVFAFQSVGLNGERWPLMSIRSMAGRYLKELQTRFSNGEFVLAGTCMGGLIAMEMAGQSRGAGGGGIGRVFVIDTELPARPRSWSAAGDRLMDDARDLFRVLRWRVRRLARSSVTRNALPAYRRFVHAMNCRARRRYRPRPFPGTLMILRAAEGGRNGNDDRPSLRDLARHSREMEVRGHRGRLFLPPAVDDLAGRLDALLREP